MGFFGVLVLPTWTGSFGELFASYRHGLFHTMWPSPFPALLANLELGFGIVFLGLYTQCIVRKLSCTMDILSCGRLDAFVLNCDIPSSFPHR